MNSYACRNIRTSEKILKNDPKKDSKEMASATYLETACHKVSKHKSNLKGR